jgi:hypothetical protein
MSPEDSIASLERLRREWFACEMLQGHAELLKDKGECLRLLARFKVRLKNSPELRARVASRWRFSC